MQAAGTTSNGSAPWLNHIDPPRVLMPFGAFRDKGHSICENNRAAAAHP